ncbi:MAG: DUF386 domain-containing protein [Spirochaetaceae bacterium]|nr:MAG: DUF386 domain-containing protein [Spirochaetaceae bacterium]
MILDSHDYLLTYVPMHARLAEGLTWLHKTDLAALEEGTFPLGDGAVTAMVQVYDTIPAEEARFEAHRRYIDIQYLISGTEAIVWTPVAGLKPTTEYDTAKDIQFFGDHPGTNLILTPGLFTVFFLPDAHKTRCLVETAGPVRKVVIKVPVA